MKNIIIGVTISIFLASQAYAGCQPEWKVNDNRSPAVPLNNPSDDIYICYTKGDGDYIQIDNSNSRGLNVGNMLKLKKNRCRQFSIESGPNLGIFLQNGASFAKGTYEIR